MEFNLQKVYSAANADTLPMGSYCFGVSFNRGIYARETLFNKRADK